MIFSSSSSSSPSVQRPLLSLVLAIIVTSWIFFIAFVGQPTTFQPAYGHATPSTYSIEPNSILQSDPVPSELVISFSERPDPQISYIRVTNSQNERIDNDDFTVSDSNPRQATVTLDTTKLEEDGVYTVSWRALSLDDGHIAQGSYVFGVGNVTPENVIGDGNQQQTQTQTVTYVTSTADALLRWPLIVSQTAVVGGIMAYFVLQRGVGRRGFSNNLSSHPNQFSIDMSLSAKKRFVLILVAGGLSIAISATALVFLQASYLDAEATGSDQYVSTTLQTLIFNSSTGVVWTIRIATSVVIAGLALLYFALAKRKTKFQTKSSSAILLAILAAGAVSIFSNSMLSHNSAATFLPSVAVFADWVHFMAVSAWVGGLFYFSAVLLFAINSNGRKTGESAAAYHLSVILPRFSLIATASLGIIGVTGLYMAWIHLHTLDSLFYTPYGSNLIIKLSAALPMVLLGAYHQVKLHKGIVLMASIGGSKKKDEGGYSTSVPDAISNTTGHAVSKFGKTVKIESLIAIGVLFAASLLTITSPPSQMQQVQQGGGVTTGAQGGAMPEMGMQNMTTTPGFSEQVTISGVDTTLEIAPFHAGFNTFTVTLSDEATGSPPQNINAIYLRFTNPEARIGPIVTTLNSTGDGSEDRYSAVGGYLSQMGNWEIDLVVQRLGAYDLNYSFEVELGASSGHENMNMGADMNMHMEDHEASTATTSTNINATENELVESPAPPELDSFAWLAIGLSVAVGVGSAYYFRKSKQQLEGTLKRLEG